MALVPGDEARSARAARASALAGQPDRPQQSPSPGPGPVKLPGNTRTSAAAAADSPLARKMRLLAAQLEAEAEAEAAPEPALEVLLPPAGESEMGDAQSSSENSQSAAWADHRDPEMPTAGDHGGEPVAGWYYIDRSGVEQGPYPIEHMRYWVQTAAMPASTLVKPSVAAAYQPATTFGPITDGLAVPAAQVEGPADEALDRTSSVTKHRAKRSGRRPSKRRPHAGQTPVGRQATPAASATARLTPEEIQFFVEHGYVIKSGLMSPEHCAMALDAVWESNRSCRLRRDDPSTWVGPVRSLFPPPLVLQACPRRWLIFACGGWSVLDARRDWHRSRNTCGWELPLC